MLKSRPIQLAIYLLLLLMASPLGAVAAPPLPPLLKQGLERLNQLHGFSAHFVQTITYQNGDNNRYEGTIALLRPGKFRWQYTKPYQQLYVSDGHGVWHYEPDLLQAVHLTNLNSIDPVALQLLDGRVGLADVKLIARDHTHPRQFTIRVHNRIELTLELDAQANLIALTHLDMLGNHNRIALSNIDPTPPNPRQFRFSPPDGVDIVRQGE
ncbi:MAG: outer-membrane lipoprotein carrier protein LolA [Mariprofundales bacterium]|nr:outer-membrane lipoprotein carrier protein LolA [Mariprofundales bacterium]